MIARGNAQRLANTAWAFATADQSDALMFAALAKAAMRRVGEFNAQGPANTAWAFATAYQSDTLRHSVGVAWASTWWRGVGALWRRARALPRPEERGFWTVRW